MGVARFSPFLHPGTHTDVDTLAILHLKRDLQIPILLRKEDENDEGYEEGKVTNTRFGSFPHTTLIGLPWGSQVRASAVDTGSRGRRKQHEHQVRVEKRKRDDESSDEVANESKKTRLDKLNEVSTPGTEASELTTTPKTAVAALSGFIHILPPTPESWTISLPHRTQVVYTPDYSYILQRLRVQPGSVLIEAGAGSGSFTHAAARAAFDGYRQGPSLSEGKPASVQQATGRIWSFEFHEERVQKLKVEISNHGLEDVVTVTHRDVCADGFFVLQDSVQLVHADAVFLDLPAPWLALKHLTRQLTEELPTNSLSNGQPAGTLTDSPRAVPSVLNPTMAVRICTFSPCIEQVQRTVTTLQQLGWLDIEMVEIAAKRLDIRRERIGLQEEGLRGVHATASNVEEAVTRLREIDRRNQIFHEESAKVDGNLTESISLKNEISKQERLAEIKAAQVGRKLYNAGRLVHRVEQELKSHTSYLLFAILPRTWTLADEEAAAKKWAGKANTPLAGNKTASKRQKKRQAKARPEGNQNIEDIEQPKSAI